GLTVKMVVPAVAVQAIVPRPAVDDVLARSTAERVAAVAVVDLVISRASVSSKVVYIIADRDRIIARTGVDEDAGDLAHVVRALAAVDGGAEGAAVGADDDRIRVVVAEYGHDAFGRNDAHILQVGEGDVVALVGLGNGVGAVDLGSEVIV